MNGEEYPENNIDDENNERSNDEDVIHPDEFRDSKSPSASLKRKGSRPIRRYPKKSSNNRANTEKREEIRQIQEELINFPKSWWGQQWIKSLLEFGRPYRMQRGLRYAQEDRIENFLINPGQIFATVQGTAPTPYRVKILFDVIPEKGWVKIIEKISQKARYVIQLLENILPRDFEVIFREMTYSFFPPPTQELNATCSCPDQAVPCKHIAATALYLARIVDFDPFLLLKLRGKTREELLSELYNLRSCANRPIVQSTKKIRENFVNTIITFDVPNYSLVNINPSKFMTGDPYEVGFQLTLPGTKLESLENLGFPPNLHDPKSFELTFRELYYEVTRAVHAKAKDLENSL